MCATINVDADAADCVHYATTKKHTCNDNAVRITNIPVVQWL